MLNIEKSSLILILIIVILIAGFVSLVTLGYTPGSVWHKAEDIKPGEVGKSVGATATSTYLFPNLEAKSQVTAGTNFHVGATTITSGKVTGLDIPTNANDAATKAYVDEQIAQLASSSIAFTIIEGNTCPEGQAVASRYYPETTCNYVDQECGGPICSVLPIDKVVTIGPGWGIDPDVQYHYKVELICSSEFDDNDNRYCISESYDTKIRTCTAQNTHVLCIDENDLPIPPL